MSAKGCIFDIKRYAIHDGPGIRLSLFFKGCPLSCQWCHNPEGIDPVPQLIFNKSGCLGCNACEDHTLPDNCPSGALELCGKYMDSGQVMDIILREKTFFDRSGGGVTFTGGEPLAQPVFLLDLLKACKGKGIHTAVDTSLYASPQVVSEIIPYTGLFLADLKIMDPLLHRKFTGVDNTLIHENLRHVACSGVPFMIRIPFIHGINNDGSGIDAMVRFILELRDSGNLQGIHLLPYHNFGTDKKKRIISGKVLFQRSFSTPQKESIDSLFLKFQSLGIVTMIGG
jgi:pyruvate formate lyase activating enzyme